MQTSSIFNHLFSVKSSLILPVLLMTAPSPALADDWMSRLDDGAYLTQLSIPGTHDAATGNGFSDDWTDFGESFARTQALPLDQQWASGIRAFDLRPAVTEEGLHIYHGIIPTQLSFADALHLLRDSLEAHPTEFAIVILRHEDDSESDADKNRWTRLMKDVVAEPELAAIIQPFSRNLTVADMRGRLLLLSRNAYQGSRGGIISGWSNSAKTADQRQATITHATGSLKAPLYCQDFYDCSADGATTTKTNTLRAMLDYSTKQHTARSNTYTWVINHTSGYTLTSWGISTSDGYRDNAARQNAAVIEYLADEAHQGPTGIVMMDFAGVDRSGDFDVMGMTLIRALIDNNFRYTPKVNPQVGIHDLTQTDPQQATSHPADSCTSSTSLYYDLNGRKTNHPSTWPGIYIHDGKKYLVP